MALDPNAPDPWSWVPPEWNPADAAAPDPLEVTLGPRGTTIPGTVQPTPPPPPPPPDPSAAGATLRGRGGATRVGETTSAAPDEVAKSSWPPAEWHAPVQNSPDYIGGTVDEQGNLQSPGAPGIEADAISAADPRAGVDDVIGGVRTEKPTDDQSLEGIGKRADTRVANAGGLPSIAEHENELAGIEAGQAMANMPMEQQIIEKAKIDAARQKFASAKLLDIATKQQQMAEANAKARKDAIDAANARGAQLDAEARQIADENPLDRISGGTKILGVIASIFGGFAANKTGRNMGLETVMSIAEDAAQQHLQKLNLNARQRADVNGLVGQAEDNYRAAEAVKLATIDSAIKTMEAEVQNFDPRGTTALRVMGDINQLKAARQEAWQKSIKDDFDQRIKLHEAGIKEREQAVKEGDLLLKANAQDAKLAGAGAAKPVKFEDQPMTVEELRAHGVQIPASVNLPPGATLSLNQAENLAKTGKAAEDWVKAARENSPEERNRQFAVGELVDDSGKALQFRSTEGAQKVGEQKAAADFMVQLLDRMDAAYQQHGWSSDLLKSPEWQEAQADLNQYILEKKNLDQLGVLAGPDLDLIKGSYGHLDVTGMRDPGAGLRRARGNTIEKLNSTVRAQAAAGVKPKRWEPPKPPPEAPKSPEQEAVSQILKFRVDKPMLDETRDADSHVPQVDADGATEANIPNRYKRRIEQLIAVQNNPNVDEKERAQATAFLKSIMDNAASKVVRDWTIKKAGTASMEAIPAKEDL